MSKKTTVSIGCGNCGCLSFVVFILLFWSIFFGLPTPWGNLNIDIIPPAIKLDQ